MRRLIFALAAIVILSLSRPCPARADGGAQLANLVAQATGLARIYDSTLASVAAVRTAEANFDHRPLDELTSQGWSVGEVIGWNRLYADPYAAVVTGWMTSTTGHRELLLNPFYARIGCDHRSGVATSDGKVWDYFVCIVGSLPGDAPAPPLATEIPDTRLYCQ